MRYLGTVNHKDVDFEDVKINGNVSVFYVRENKYFVRSKKINMSSGKKDYVSPVFAIVDVKNDVPQLTSYHNPSLANSKPAQKSFAGFLENLIKDYTATDEVKEKISKIEADKSPHIVRSIRNINFHTYAPRAQNFALGLEKSPGWYSCRDGFANVFTNKTKAILFCVADENKDYKNCNLRARRVARFVRRVEEILKLKETSKFYETSYHNVIEIEPAKFWVEDPLKRSLFTILPRAGLIYNFREDNLWDAFKGYGYSKNTLPAIQRFLDGHTKYTGKQTISGVIGWTSVFQGVGKKQAEELLK